MTRKKSVSSRDVAKEAGVSQATVSYVLNNVQNVKIKPETRQAVLEAAKRLNYCPDYTARGMRLKRSMSIGVVTERNVTNFYFMKTLEGIKDAIQPCNYSITLLFSKPGELSDVEFIKYYYSNRLDGIIFAFDLIDESICTYMNEKGIPFVMVDVNPADYDMYEVSTDLLDHVSDVAGYLKSKGVRSIGYAGPIAARDRGKRIDKLKEAALRLGMEISDGHIVYSPWEDGEIQRVVTHLLTAPERPEAIVAGSPRFGLLTARCASMLNLEVPGSLRFISLGSSNLYTMVHPSISAVEVPLYDMGYRAAEKLIHIINGHAVEKTTILPSELVIRDSS